MGGLRAAILLPDLRGGGAERVMVNLANGLAERGHAVELLLMRAEGAFLPEVAAPVGVRDLGCARVRAVPTALARALRETRPDALLACMWPLTTIAVAARAAASPGTRLVVAEHNTWGAAQSQYGRATRVAIRASMRAGFPWADAVVAVSEGAADDLAAFAGLARDQITVVYNPVTRPTPPGRALREGAGPLPPPNHRWSAAPRRVLSVGTLKPQKNHDLLLRAFARVAREHDVHLAILGEGPLRGALEARAAALGVADRVHLPGFDPDPRPWLAHANAFALSSDWEGLPTVLIEALAEGIPVVSTDCPSGPREILRDGAFGALVPPGEEAALARALEGALRDPGPAEPRRARAADFSVDRAVDAYLGLLRGRPA